MKPMKSTLTVLLLLVPALALGQSLGEVAKKEKERRERNKREGRKVIVVSEEELFPEEAEGDADSSGEVSGESSSTGSTAPPRSRSRDDEEYDEEGDYIDEERVPTNIPPGIPMEERLEMFQLMKRHYERQVREIDQAIAENNERIRQLDAKIGATSAAGGAGLPVAPRTGTGAEMSQMTGQESQTLIAERERLQAMNEQMTRRKEQMKLDLQTKGRVAGIPPGYLRF